MCHNDMDMRIIRTRTKSVMVGFVCSDGMSNVMLNIIDMLAIGHACQIARVQKDM